jgi:hypothetical protein
MFPMVLISLIWEATLAIPYGGGATSRARWSA